MFHMDAEFLRQQFSEKLAHLQGKGAEIGSIALILAALDEALSSGELQRNALIQDIAQAADMSFALYGRFTHNPRLKARDGHSIAAHVSGPEGPLAKHVHPTNPWETSRRIETALGGGGRLWNQAVRRGINVDSPDHQAAAIKSVDSEGNPFIALVINDHSKDDRPNSHTDFYVMGAQEKLEALWQASNDYPDTLPKLFEMMFPGDDIMADFSAVKVQSHFMANQ